MKREPIVVIGATGHVGREVVRELLSRHERVRVFVRSEASAARVGHDVEVALGDLSDRRSLDAALAGARGVFFVTPHHADEERYGRNVIEAAEEARVARFVYSAAYRWSSPNRLVDKLLVGITGLLGPHYTPKLRVSARAHASSVSHVVLRPSNFFQNDEHTRALFAAGRYVHPLGHKAVNRVDVRDIAQAAARALAPDGGQLVPDGAWPLVGPRSLDGPACAAAWSNALGRSMHHEGDIEAWTEAVKHELADDIRLDWVKTYRLLQRFGLTTSAKELALTTRVLGRAPRSYEAYVEEHARAWGLVGGRDPRSLRAA